MTRLSRATLANLPASIERPAYDPAALGIGIVHLGLGAFQRAHMAAYLQPLLAGDPRWGVAGASLRSDDTRDALTPQDGLYALCEASGDGDRITVMGGLRAIHGPADGDALMRRMVAPDTRIVSLTVTEKGYLRGSDGGLDLADPGVRADLSGTAAPRTVPGLLVAALRQRREAGLAPFTVLSCDNLPGNGHVVARILSDYARADGSGLADWIADTVACPNTMVDRIVPATTDADRRRIAAALGLEDAWPVMAEPFSQWVIEDRFPAGRPAWEDSGATMVADARPWEEMKLRLLNGSHSTIAYLGLLAGWETVADAMRVPALADHVAALMDESAATLRMAPGTDLGGYRDQLLQRFRNTALKHRTRQIASDGSQKIPQRLLAPGAVLAAEGRGMDRIALGIAAWLRVAGGHADDGKPLPLDDPQAGTLRALAAPGRSPDAVVAALFDESGLVPERDRHPALRDAITRMLTALATYGAAGTLDRLRAGSPL
ncbi:MULTISPECIES: mannitol dehydrogenase family protein [unclassified Sphingomonas]|jgi:fructuronate reductase|uniref:mannitol dehydrogenase family protein n=1 Tax=unclassified Sphingomonas TaxID=196159 RepID=UPI0025EE9674|nr:MULTISPECIES: mannitol dehydrogenase family protein [unclassified Sphingomonas]